jgi:putative ABC transport system permease protein
VRSAIVVAELALAMVLLVGAGLLTNSFTRILAVDVGYDADRVLALDLQLPERRYPDAARRAAFFGALEERLRALPGVEQVSIAEDEGYHFGTRLEAEGSTPPAGEQGTIPMVGADSGYFRTMGIPILAGRGFTAADGRAAERPAIIDVDLARFLWGKASPIGRRMRLEPESDWLTVVGVAGDVKILGPGDRSGRFEVYRPIRPDRMPPWRTVYLRTATDPATLVETAKRAVWAIDPEQPVESVGPLAQRVSETLARPRFLLTVMSAFAAVALLLAAVGIYGVMTYAVAQRTREIGVRMALGARPGEIMRSVVRGGAVLAIGGIAIGLAGALALTRFVESLLFDVTATDPKTYAAVAVLLIGVAGLAALVPARRASRVSPMAALRE